MVHVPEKPEQNRLKTMKTIDLAGGMLPGARKVGTYRWHTIHQSFRKHGYQMEPWISEFTFSKTTPRTTCAGMWFVDVCGMYRHVFFPLWG